MAPYSGPSLAECIRLVLTGQIPSALGFGLPRAVVKRTGEVWSLIAMRGGEGFGVQADLVRPFEEYLTIGQAVTPLKFCILLIQQWDEGPYGTSFPPHQALEMTVRIPEEGRAGTDVGTTERVVCRQLIEARQHCVLIDERGQELIGLRVVGRPSPS